jgi:hypothetical protein
MIDTVRKTRSLHRCFIKAGYEVARIVRRDKDVPGLVRHFEGLREDNIISKYSFVPGNMVPEARKYCIDLDSVEDLSVFYVLRVQD